MRFQKVTAIIPRDSLENVERALREMGVPAITVSQAKGYGEYKNFFSHDWKIGTARIEIFATCDEAESIASAIMDAAPAGLESVGIVAISPVQQLYHIRTRAAATDADVCCCANSSAKNVGDDSE